MSVACLRSLDRAVALSSMVAREVVLEAEVVVGSWQRSKPATRGVSGGGGSEERCARRRAGAGLRDRRCVEVGRSRAAGGRRMT